MVAIAIHSGTFALQIANRKPEGERRNARELMINECNIGISENAVGAHAPIMKRHGAGERDYHIVGAAHSIRRLSLRCSRRPEGTELRRSVPYQPCSDEQDEENAV